MPFKYPSPAERIIANSVIDESGYYKGYGDPEGSFCWRWLRGYKRSRRGRLYPYTSYRNRKGKSVKITVHRFIITKVKKRRLSKRQVGMHLCNNEWCVNFNHIDGGTQKKNIRQCVQDGRHVHTDNWKAYNSRRRAMQERKAA